MEHTIQKIITFYLDVPSFIVIFSYYFPKNILDEIFHMLLLLLLLIPVIVCFECWEHVRILAYHFAYKSIGARISRHTGQLRYNT